MNLCRRTTVWENHETSANIKDVKSSISFEMNIPWSVSGMQPNRSWQEKKIISVKSHSFVAFRQYIKKNLVNESLTYNFNWLYRDRKIFKNLLFEFIPFLFRESHILLECRTKSLPDIIPSAHFCIGGHKPSHVLCNVDIIPPAHFYKVD